MLGVTDRLDEMVIFRPVSGSRNAGEEVIQQDVELPVPLPVETVSGIFHTNRSTVPEVRESQAVNVIEIDHGVVGAVDDGQRNRRSFDKGSLIGVLSGKGCIDHQLARAPVCSSDSGFPKRIVDRVRSERQRNDHVNFPVGEGLLSRISEVRIGNEAERSTFRARWDWRCTKDHRPGNLFWQEPHEFQGDMAAQRVAEYGETIDVERFYHFGDGIGISIEIVGA